MNNTGKLTEVRPGQVWLCGGLAIALGVACAPPQVMIPSNGAGGQSSAGTGGTSGGASGGPSGGSTGGSSGAGGGFTVADGGGVSPDALAIDTGTCGFEKFDLQHRPAELLLVLDRSGSMADAPRGALVSKWDQAIPALDEVIAQTEKQILWGLKLFPVGNDQTCASADGIDVPLMLNNSATVITAYKTAGPRGDGTPTSEAIKRAVAHLKANPSNNNRYLVLATDGQPTCPDGIDGDASDAVNAIQAVKDAAAAGLHTFVVGIATDAKAGATLDSMALAGLEPRAAAPHYYLASNKQDLISALGIITGKVADCTFPLSQVPPSPDDVAVKIGSTRVGQDKTHTNGWDYTPGNTSIVVYGATCERVKAGAAGDDVSITFGCPGQSIP